ncbi:metal transporter [Streptomyces sp. NPDC059816]|uniref:metal transporter n=1 Tax=Streptomyces sp. NPDC059816 TaxID=3346960 RepID=UPI00365E7645
MDTVQRRTRRAGAGGDLGLGVVCALGIAATTYLLMDSWGGASWVFGSTVSTVVSVLALLRARWPALTAALGTAVTAAALAVSLAVGDDLPQEPAPTTTLALAVLIGSAVRTLPPGAATGIAAGSLGVTALTWAEGWSAVTALVTVATVAALGTGTVLRRLDHDRRADSPAPGAPWPDPPRP